MILEEATKEAFGYWQNELPPRGNKSVIAACELCGEFSVTSKHAYRTFCRSCAHKGEKNHMFGQKHTKETKALMSRNHADFSGEKGPMFGKHASEETKAKQSAARTGRTGEKSSAWKGGISFEPYCVKFNEEYKEGIRNFFGNECFLCSLSEANNGEKLCVHHVNYNQDCGCDGSKCVCVPLCRSCHSKTNSNRNYWETLILVKLEEGNEKK